MSAKLRQKYKHSLIIANKPPLTKCLLNWSNSKLLEKENAMVHSKSICIVNVQVTATEKTVDTWFLSDEQRNLAPENIKELPKNVTKADQKRSHAEIRQRPYQKCN